MVAQKALDKEAGVSPARASRETRFPVPGGGRGPLSRRLDGPLRSARVEESRS